MYTWASNKSYFYIKLFVVYSYTKCNSGGLTLKSTSHKILIAIFLGYTLLQQYANTISDDGKYLPMWSRTGYACLESDNSLSPWKGLSFIGRPYQQAKNTKSFVSASEKSRLRADSATKILGHTSSYHIMA